jgi:hypothetical protein
LSGFKNSLLFFPFSSFPLRVMDLLDFSSISFDSGFELKRLYQYLNQLVGEGISNDTFTIRKIKVVIVACE